MATPDIVLDAAAAACADAVEGVVLSKRIVREFLREATKRILLPTEVSGVFDGTINIHEPMHPCTRKFVHLISGYQLKKLEDQRRGEESVSPEPDELFFRLCSVSIMNGPWSKSKFLHLTAIITMVFEMYIELKLRGESFNSMTEVLEKYLVDTLKVTASDWKYFETQFMNSYA